MMLIKELCVENDILKWLPQQAYENQSVYDSHTLVLIISIFDL